jgi:signal transduction histidine kinase
MIKKSLRSKLILNFVFSVVFVMLTLVAATNFIFRPILIHDTRGSMMNYATLISDNYNNGSTTISRLLAILDSSHDIETVIYYDDMRVIAAYEQIYPTSERITMIKEWMAEYGENKKADGTFFREIEENSDNLSRAVYIKELSDGVYLCMSKVVKSIDQIVYIATIGVTVGAIFLIIIGTAVWSVLTRSFTSQLKKMSIVTQKMAQLDFDEKINYHSEDEVGVLAESIDEMSDELKVSIEKLKKDVERRKRLIRDMSHELKTPITTVSGYAETIQILVPDNPKVQRYCDIMLEECDVINNLVQEMLYMSKLEDETFECKKEFFRADKLKEKILGRIENEFSAESIVWQLEDVDISADINLLERAVYNFITNAIKHKQEGSDVEVRGYKDGDGYIFAVTNYGDEISSEDRDVIWDVFYKCDRSRNRGDSGHGIGLAIVKRIADLHGGEVKLVVGDGKNTFSIKV